MERGHYQEMAEAVDKEGLSSDITIAFRKLEKAGEYIIGQLIGLNRIQGKKADETYFQYVVDTDQGMLKTAFGNAYDGEMIAVLHIGGVYRWTFVEKKLLKNGHTVNVVRTEVIDDSEMRLPLPEYIAANWPKA